MRIVRLVAVLTRIRICRFNVLIMVIVDDFPIWFDVNSSPLQRLLIVVRLDNDFALQVYLRLDVSNSIIVPYDYLGCNVFLEGNQMLPRDPEEVLF